MFSVCLFVCLYRNEIIYSHCNYRCLILSHWKLIYHTCFSYVFLPPIISSWYHHNYKAILENITSLLSSVLLLVHSTNYNANSNKQVIYFFGIVWYYGDNDFLIQTFNFIAHLDAVCMSWSIPNMNSRMTCSTDTGFHVICSTWYGFLHDL